MSYALECRACGTAGVAFISEKAGPPFDAEPARQYTIPDGFRLRAKASTASIPEIECSRCEALAR
ncbi:MAG: hypothetical protein ACREE0_19110 [Phenylobacterium sp.]